MRRGLSALRAGAGVAIVLATLLAGASAFAQTELPLSATKMARSISGQFIVQDRRTGVPSEAAQRLGTNTDLVVLEPTSLAVSLERLKQSLWHQLGETAEWRSQIYVALYAAQTPEDAVTITSERYRDGWQYRVDLPDVATRNGFVRGVVQVLLLELANRTADQRSAEIPLWLAEGLTQQLFSFDEIELALPKAGKSVNGLVVASTIVNRRRRDPLDDARRQLSAHPLLTFDQLSWPADDQLAGQPGTLYRLSAQVLVNELLGLKDGRVCLRAMIAQLPSRYNWQLAFLDAFHGSFARLLDVEKWWTLELVRFTGLENMLSWSLKESWQRLDEVVRPPVEVRANTNDLPLHTQITLQTMVREWEPAPQTSALKEKIRELELLRWRLAPGLIGIADGYHAVLQSYLQERDKTVFFLPFRRAAVARHAKEQAVKQLDELDARRVEIRPRLKSTDTAKTK
jgi:hypothetical protein